MTDTIRRGDFTWARKGGSWRIGYGVSNFLLAEGSGFSAAFGLTLFEELVAAPEKFRATLTDDGALRVMAFNG